MAWPSPGCSFWEQSDLELGWKKVLEGLPDSWKEGGGSKKRGDALVPLRGARGWGWGAGPPHRHRGEPPGCWASARTSLRACFGAACRPGVLTAKKQDRADVSHDARTPTLVRFCCRAAWSPGSLCLVAPCSRGKVPWGLRTRCAGPLLKRILTVGCRESGGAPCGFRGLRGRAEAEASPWRGTRVSPGRSRPRAEA